MGGCMGKAPRGLAPDSTERPVSNPRALPPENNPSVDSVVSDSTSDSDEAPLPAAAMLTVGDPGFTPSSNGRNGWRIDQVYSMGSRLGSGQFGTVFRGKHVRTGEMVAIKRTRPNRLDTNDGARNLRTYAELERKCQELRTLTKLQGANNTFVLKLHEFFIQDDGDFFLVTELLGEELDGWRNSVEAFTERMAIDVSRSIVSALQYMHSRNVVHRDLKLQNILLDSNKNLKIVDFGLARHLKPNERVRDFCGSIGYIAPEIYRGNPYRYEVDMFAFGVLLFRLLSGERPFPSNDPRVLKRDTIELKYKVQGQDWVNVSDAAKDLVRKLLINQQERLDATAVLQHPWFLEAGQSVLRADLSNLGLSNSRSRAFLLTQAPAEISRDSSRFWIDESVEFALATIISHEIYSGRVVDRTTLPTDGLICVEETPNGFCVPVPEFVAKLQPQSYTEKECRSICLQIATIIQILHSAGLAHRNLHLENILADPEGKISIKGLQCAQRIVENVPLTGHFGYLYSWYAFKAPEVDSNFTHDKSVDLWSLGAIMYMLLTGLPPFRGTGMELINMKHSGRVEFDIVVPSIQAQDLVKCLLQTEPSMRLTVEQVLDHEWMTEDDDTLQEFDLEVAHHGMLDWKNV